MSLQMIGLLDKPSIENEYGRCCVCGFYPSTNRHHIVSKRVGGKTGPTVLLCGSGTTGCHGRAGEKKLHFKWDDGTWWFKNFARPISYERALMFDGWVRIRETNGTYFKER